MKLSSTVKVTLEAPEGNAVFTFGRLKLNEQLEAMREAEATKDAPMHERIPKQFAFILNKLISFEGLEHEDGTKVKREDITNLGLDIGTMNLIIEGYYAALNLRKDDPEKKGSASA